MSAPYKPARLTGTAWHAVRRFTTFGRSKTLAERFWEKVDKTGECWLWLAGVDAGGYGKFQVDGKTRRAHHVAWELAGKKIPKGKILRHKCDTPKCVRDEHLLPGTPKENVHDAIDRGRSAIGRPVPVERRRYGERAARAMLTNEQASEIRRRYVPRRGVGALAAEFRITRSVLHDIVSGRTYPRSGT